MVACGVDTTRTNEVVGKVNEMLVPKLRELPGFAGYFRRSASGTTRRSHRLIPTLPFRRGGGST